MLSHPSGFVNSQTFEQSVWIDAPVSIVDQVITDQHYMHQWLNPVLRCNPIDEWSTEVGARSIFIVQVPILNLTLNSQVSERAEGLVVWSFDGFFQGRDRWACSAEGKGTRLNNQFTFVATSRLMKIGFQLFAAALTKRDMEQQLVRLKRVAENLNSSAP
ncbi:MAG: SRPBCC family protein [Cyanobacteria bacterium P01_F01_bin.3]